MMWHFCGTLSRMSPWGRPAEVDLSRVPTDRRSRRLPPTNLLTGLEVPIRGEVGQVRTLDPSNEPDVAHDESMSLLTCPPCGREQDAAGPGVSSRRADAGWVHSWTPFIEDLRGTPTRLLHPKCFADECGFDALVALVTEHDQRMRVEHSKRW